MDNTRFSPAYRSLFLDEPEDLPVPRPQEELSSEEGISQDMAERTAPAPQQTFAMKMFLLSVSAICWVSVITAILVVTFFVCIIGVAISRGL